MEKRVRFQSAWLPWALLAPQLAIVAVFFFWPAAQAILQSLQVEDSFGLSTEWAGLDNFKTLFGDSAYLESFKTTAIFSILVAVLGIALSLMLAVFLPFQICSISSSMMVRICTKLPRRMPRDLSVVFLIICVTETSVPGFSL